MRTPAKHSPQGMRRRLVASVLTIAGALSMTAAIAPQAQAQPSACANKLCLFEHNYERGRYVAYATGSDDMSRYGPYFNDMTSSVHNNTGSRWCLWEHAGRKGRVITVGPWASIPGLGYPWNDSISSARTC